MELMKLTVISHKPCWRSPGSPSGYATDGGFPFQMRALSELFDGTRLLVPCVADCKQEGEEPLIGHNLSVVPLPVPSGTGVWRKVGLVPWLLRNVHVLIRELSLADAVHAPIPGDVGTIGMIIAFALRKPLFVRHCGNWLAPRTAPEHFWKWFMERFAGGRNVMLATGGAPEPPSKTNPFLRWIFSTSLTGREMEMYAKPRCRLFRVGPRLLIAGRQEEAKGTGVVISALPLILKEFPSAHLDVLGDGRDLHRFKALAESLEVGRHVQFHGRLGHRAVMKKLQEADLFCFPTSSFEGFPKVVIEALACGLPVITTKVSVLPHLLSRGCGVVLEERTPEAVAWAVRYCLNDEERYRAMSLQAVRTARPYSLERWRDEIGTILQEAWGPLRNSEHS